MNASVVILWAFDVVLNGEKHRLHIKDDSSFPV